MKFLEGLFRAKSPVERINNWINKISKKEKLPGDIKAINFGIFETPKGYTFHLVGSKEFDKNNTGWATVEDYSPKNKYCSIEYSSAKPGWEEFLSFAKDIISNIIPQQDFFSAVQYITIGFDDGDLLVIKDDK